MITHDVVAHCSRDYAEALAVQEQLLRDAIVEVDEYCEKSSWLNEIYRFCNGWHDKSVLDWRGASGFLLEVSSGWHDKSVLDWRGASGFLLEVSSG